MIVSLFPPLFFLLLRLRFTYLIFFFLLCHNLKMRQLLSAREQAAFDLHLTQDLSTNRDRHAQSSSALCVKMVEGK